ncbi:MAG: hypothetical protein H0X63_12205, partial [Flavobacteriales bacterium]|nr:hypothetical protein [Flavobacteriales bacterium]
METQKQIKIMVVEDSEFYNSVLSKQLKNFTDVLSYLKNVTFDIQSYTYSQDCIRNITKDIDIIFSDYYLGNRITAFDVLQQVKKTCTNCKF